MFLGGRKKALKMLVLKMLPLGSYLGIQHRPDFLERKHPKFYLGPCAMMSKWKHGKKHVKTRYGNEEKHPPWW